MGFSGGTGLDALSGGTGIALGFTKALCQTTPAGDESLWIEDTYVLGPGTSVDDGEDYVGIRANWLCGGDERSIDIVGNWIEAWEKVGLEFVQTADVTVGCNQVVGNRRAVDIYRDHEPTGAAIRFKQNRLEALINNSSLFALRTDDAIKTKLGPSSISERGLNRLKVHKDDTKFIFEEDPNSSDVLDARDNFWYADTLFTAASDTTKIHARLAPSGFNVDISSFETDDSGVPACWLGAPGASTVAGGRSETSPEDRIPSPSAGGAIPVVTTLSPARPNPGRGGIAMSLGVASDAVGTYELAVFDVVGRRVWAERRSAPQAGVYRVDWSGRDDTGTPVATGIYFLRLTGPGDFVQTRKVTLLR